jgi:hypothetical protein
MRLVSGIRSISLLGFHAHIDLSRSVRRPHEGSPMADLIDIETLALRARPVRGPVTRRRLRGFLTGSALVAAVVVSITLTSDDGSIRAFALGLLLPGAGFAYGIASPVLAVVLVLACILAFAVCLGWWMFLGNVLAPPTVVLGSAAVAAFTVGPGVRRGVVPIVLIVFALIVAGVATREVHRQRAVRRRARQRNGYLATIPAPALRSPAFATTELSRADLAHQRWLLDLALQPLDRFDGFDRLDQFSFSALRYQLNFAQYALAMSQRYHTPAFHGYVSAAQRNLIEKMLQPRVWRYWRSENLWGNLDPNPDPIRRENIMFSGYLGLMLSLYRNASGDRRYDRPGSLEFRTRRGQVFSYDHPTIMEVLTRQFAAEPSGLWACHPGLAYPMCNTLGAAGVVGAEPHHGQGRAEPVLAALRRGLAEEYTYPDGSTAHARSVRFGFATPGIGTGTVIGAWLRANFPLLLRPLDPAAAQRLWEILRREDIQLIGGEISLPRANPSDRRDIGNLRASMAHLWGWLYADAREFGDPEIAAAALRAAEDQLDPQDRGGARAYARASVHANAVFNLGRFIDEHGYTDAVRAPLPEQWRNGPLLADAPYPQCLVAHAETDGTDLRLALRPGDGGGRITLSLARLRPGREYLITGATAASLTAAGDGTAMVDVDLNDRTQVRLHPGA